jgi:peptide/nickel transport system permease protein
VWAYTSKRVGSALLVAVGVSCATFLLLHVEPGDPARLVLGEHATPAQIAALRHQWGLDRSLPAQFVHFVSGLVHGDLGTSYFYGVPVLRLVEQRIWLTLGLVAIATLFAVLITLPLATVAAARKDGIADHLVRAISVAGLGLPAFWFGIVLIEIFAVHLGWLPVGGDGDSFAAHLEGLVLPGLTAAFAIVPLLVRSLRVGMIDVLGADFVATARAKGAGELRVLVAHVARNALVPTVALLGVNVAYLVGSTVVVERVFDLHGAGALLLDAITNRDFPVVQAATLVLALVVVLVNLATDLVTARLDPRIRLG